MRTLDNWKVSYTVTFESGEVRDCERIVQADDVSRPVLTVVNDAIQQKDVTSVEIWKVENLNHKPITPTACRNWLHGRFTKGK